MNDQFKEFADAPAPVLTFGEPVMEEAPLAAKKEEPKPAEPQFSEAILSEEEQKMVDAFSKQIDLHNSNGILQYGVGT